MIAAAIIVAALVIAAATLIAYAACVVAGRADREPLQVDPVPRHVAAALAEYQAQEAQAARLAAIAADVAAVRRRIVSTPPALPR